MKHICIFSGGGTRGMFQVGAWQYLAMEEGYTADIFAGSSVGSINAAFIAADRFDILKHLWFKSADHATLFFPSDFLDHQAKLKISAKTLQKVFQHLFTKKKIGGIVSMRGVSELLEVVKCNDLKERGKELIVNFASLHTGKNFSYMTADFPTDKALHNAIIASASFPGIFPAREVSTYTHFHSAAADAGIARGGILGAAVDYARSLDEEVKFTIILTTAPDNPTEADYSSIEKNVLRSLEIALNTIAGYELTLFRERNALAGYKRFSYRVIQPSPEYQSGYMDFSYDTLHTLFDHGRHKAAASQWYVL